MELPTDIVASKLEVDDKNGKMKQNVGMALRIMNKRMNAIEQQGFGGGGISDIDIRYLHQMPFFYLNENEITLSTLGQINFVNPLDQTQDTMHDNGILHKNYMYCVKSNYIQVNKDSYVHFEKENLSTYDICSITLVSKYTQPSVSIVLWGSDNQQGNRGVGSHNWVSTSTENTDGTYNFYYESTIKIYKETNDWSGLFSIDTIGQIGPMYITNVTFSTGTGGSGTQISISEDTAVDYISHKFTSNSIPTNVNSIFTPQHPNNTTNLLTLFEPSWATRYYEYIYTNDYITVTKNSYIMLKLNTIDMLGYNTINMDIYTEVGQDIRIGFYIDIYTYIGSIDVLSLQASVLKNVTIPISGVFDEIDITGVFDETTREFDEIDNTLYISNIYAYSSSS